MQPPGAHGGRARPERAEYRPAGERPPRARPWRQGSPGPIPNPAVKPAIAESTAGPARGRTGRRARGGRFSAEGPRIRAIRGPFCVSGPVPGRGRAPCTLRGLEGDDPRPEGARDAAVAGEVVGRAPGVAQVDHVGQEAAAHVGHGVLDAEPAGCRRILRLVVAPHGRDGRAVACAAMFPIARIVAPHGGQPPVSPRARLVPAGHVDGEVEDGRAVAGVVVSRSRRVGTARLRDCVKGRSIDAKGRKKGLFAPSFVFAAKRIGLVNYNRRIV